MNYIYYAYIQQTLEKIDSGYRLPPPPGCPRAMYRMMMKCWYVHMFINCNNYCFLATNVCKLVIYCLVFYRHPDPRSRPQFGQITKLLSGSSGHLLGWSDEDKQIVGEDAAKLGAPLESTYHLYTDLQQSYHLKKLHM